MLKKYIQKPLSFSLLLLSVLMIGVYCIYDLPVKMYPDMVKPKFYVSFGHRDIGRPMDLYRSYGKSIVEQLRIFKGLESYTVSYQSNHGKVEMQFEWNINEEDTRKKIENVFAPLRSGASAKFWNSIYSSSSQSTGNMMISVSNDKMSSEQLQESLNANLMAKIRKIDNVSNANIWSGNQNSLMLEVDRDKLLTYKLDINHVISKIKSSLRNSLAGKISDNKSGRGSIQVSIPAKAMDINDLLNVRILTDIRNNLVVKIKDIAQISEISIKRDAIYRLNGKNANFMSVTLKAEGDVKKTCDLVEDELSLFSSENPYMVFDILSNPSSFIKSAINNLLSNAFIGGGIAVLVILFFLGTISNTLIIGISIPFCIITSFILMKVFGVTINIISLGGMAIGVGMILDSSIVTLENIYRKIQLYQENIGELSADKRVQLVIEGTKEVALPILSSILTSVVVFLPIIYTSSYTQAILGDLAKTVVFTLSISIVASILIVPVAGFKFIQIRDASSSRSMIIFEKMNNMYTRILRKVVKSKGRCWGIIAISSLLFISTLFLIPSIRKEIIAKPATTLLDIKVDMRGNEDIRLTDKYVVEVESYLKTLPEIKDISTYVGGAAFGWITSELADRHHFEKIQKLVKEKFPPNPDVTFTPQKWDPGRMPLPRHQADLIVNVAGKSDKEMTAFIDQILSKRSELKARMHSKPWRMDDEKIAVNYHPWVNESSVSSLRSYLEVSSYRGAYITEIMSDGRNRNLNLIFRPEQRASYLDELQNFPVLYAGKIVPLNALASVEIVKDNYLPMYYVDGIKMQQVMVYFKSEIDSEKVELAKKFKKVVGKLNPPVDISITYPDPNKEINKSFDSFKVSLIISIGLVFLIIALLFNSLMYPLMILATVPFAVTGVILGLYVADSSLSLNSMLGTILLSGLVVNNAILFIDFFISQKESGVDGITSILNAAELRFRPILMTTLTTLFGVIPIALAYGEGGEILQPLGISIFFGLMVSTILGLLVIPSFLRIVDTK